MPETITRPQTRYINPICMECPFLVFDDILKIVDGMVVSDEPMCGYEGPGSCADEEGLL